MTTRVTRDHVAELDRNDPIAGFRELFLVPEDVVYFDGNSLGPPPKRALKRLDNVLRGEWGNGLVRSWNSAGWIDLPERVAAKIAPLIGARPGEVMVADSTSVNIFKLLAAALRLRPERRIILSDEENFGTDLYVAQGLADLLGTSAELKTAPRGEIVDAVGEDVAVVMLTQVDFRTGEMLDMEQVTEAVHGAGAVVLWDLAHSAGAVEVDLAASGADLAVGCGYKYLNGGPGAPAFAFVADRHLQNLESPLWGWMGHAAPFEFASAFEPEQGIGRLRVGTPPILSLAALECGVDTIAEIGMDRLRAKSVAMTSLFIDLVEQECPDFGFELVSPRRADRRGSQVSLRHHEGHAIVQALIAAGVIGDFRAPDILRFGFTPAYLRFVDVWDGVAKLRDIMAKGLWNRPAFHRRSKVT